MSEHMMPCQNHQSRTCLRVDVLDGMTLFVPFNLDGLEVKRVHSSKFDLEYKALADYGVERACEHYLKYAMQYGATDEVLGYLGRVLNIKPNEATMAKTKAAAKETAETEVKAEKKSKATKTEKPSTKAAEPVKASKGKAKKPDLRVVQDELIPLKKTKAKTGEKKRTVAQAFRELIMEGKLTDDKIFAKVQAEFSLTDDKRAYVKWYRNDLRKSGQNPPDAK